jgi:fatty-acyl-CoA synthase
MSFMGAIGRELTYVSSLFKTLKWIKDIKADSENLVCDDFERTVDRMGPAAAVIFEGRTWSWLELDALSNRFAHWATEQGLARGDAVALFMPNRPEYLACWLGLTKVGVVVALINSNLQGAALAHCVKIADAKAAIVDSDLQDAWKTAALDTPAWCFGPSSSPFSDLESALSVQLDTRPDRAVARAGMTADALALYVYTSGTTGHPKAARLTHMRTQTMMRAFIAATRAAENERIYITLPLYHGTGGLCAVGIAMMTGSTIVLRRKFSASAFWDDVVDNRCTIFVYIGELCRYLVNQPVHPKERAHQLKSIFGNGMRPEVWERFDQRFAIPRIVEFYGSTEGNVAMANYEGRFGSIGRIPKYMDKVFNTALVKFDVETEQPVRGADGLCIPCAPGEVGEAIGKIGEELRARFDGYAGNPEANAKKVLRDVFEKGDMWFRTGDLMKKDAEGYHFFVDRIGDTFRWKSENVSTQEVGEALGVFPGVKEANVYGVAVPGHDGRAGMASIVAEEGLDLDALAAHVAKELPGYARPLFLRLKPEVEITGTFKYRKVDLVKEGFDPSATSDPLYWLDPATGRYAPLTGEVYAMLTSGTARL